jgi:HSP20 family molecular chaperone IbpA
MDMTETDAALVVSVAVPAIEPEDIHLQVDERSLILGYEYREGEKRQTMRTSMRLPVRVDPDATEAIMREDTLVITMPKRQPISPKPLSVRRG